MEVGTIRSDTKMKFEDKTRDNLPICYVAVLPFALFLMWQDIATLVKYGASLCYLPLDVKWLTHDT